MADTPYIIKVNLTMTVTGTLEVGVPVTPGPVTSVSLTIDPPRLKSLQAVKVKDGHHWSLWKRKEITESDLGW